MARKTRLDDNQVWRLKHDLPFVMEYPQEVLPEALAAQWVHFVSCVNYAYNALEEKRLAKKNRSKPDPDYPWPTVEDTRALLALAYEALEQGQPEKQQVKAMMHRIGLAPTALPVREGEERQR